MYLNFPQILFIVLVLIRQNESELSVNFVQFQLHHLELRNPAGFKHIFFLLMMGGAGLSTEIA